MCGIAGQIGFYSDMRMQEDIMKKMSAVLAPRGPDASGVYCDEAAYLVHRRLIVVDPENGCQPMTAGQYTIVYNGELYNTEEIRAGLISRGIEFNGHSDTEVVLKAFIQYGEDCAKLFNGIFAFAVWDSRKRRLFLCRDRIGVKPLFYSFVNGGLLFASEIKSLLQHPAVQPVITQQGVMEIMLMGPAKRVGGGVFRDISELPPAHYAYFDSDGFTMASYWKLKAEAHTESFEETSAHIRELITDAVKRQLVSDVPLCCFLSGGLDSSIISAIAAEEFRKRGKKLSTWSIDYKDNHRNFKASSFQPDEDAPWIVKMAEFIGSNHTDVVLDTPALTDALDDAVLARDLPGMADVDSSLYLFCKEIKKRFAVALSGECADEIFGGYPWYHRKEVLFYDGFPWSTAVPERAALLKMNISAAEAEDFVRQSYNETLSHAEHLDSDTAEERRMREMYLLNLEYFMATLLDRKDRMSMANGLEVRVPFCDYRIVEYAYNIPWSMKAYRGREKGLIRHAMSGILPEDVLWRKKSPYPKTHNPNYMHLLSQRLSKCIAAEDCRLTEIVSADKLRELLDTDGASFTKNWYGQLMTVPQIYAFMLQLDKWLRAYDVKISN
ncbi:MAG: asparagine synthase (glutamine-hydrolyzing) [Ruminococcaceae bacterium]|nr:asparagine synthase (glutamine-hydrolyzing) [Oscillospiraceae bacterium]